MSNTENKPDITLLAAIIASGIVQSKMIIKSACSRGDNEPFKNMAMISVEIAHNIIEMSKRWEG